jgi:hypothetical protein
VQAPAPMDIGLVYGHSPSALAWSATRVGEGVTATSGQSAIAVDLASGRDRAKVGLEGHAERSAGSEAYVSVVLSGVQLAEPVSVYRVTMSGVEAEG